MASNARDQKTFVVYKSYPFADGNPNEVKVLLFATGDPVLANSERDRLNESRTSQEIYNQGLKYKVEPLPVLSRRKTRHPFMRGQNQRGLFDPETMEKDGNVDDGSDFSADRDVEAKTRGRLHRRYPAYAHE